MGSIALIMFHYKGRQKSETEMAKIKGTELVCQKQKLTKISQKVATTIMTV